MPEPEDASHRDDFERFDEAQPFLQLLADMLNRVITGQNDQGDEEAETAEETAG
jgi:hypothetical protein